MQAMQKNKGTKSRTETQVQQRYSQFTPEHILEETEVVPLQLLLCKKCKETKPKFMFITTLYLCKECQSKQMKEHRKKIAIKDISPVSKGINKFFGVREVDKIR